MIGTYNMYVCDAMYVYYDVREYANNYYSITISICTTAPPQKLIFSE